MIRIVVFHVLNYPYINPLVCRNPKSESLGFLEGVFFGIAWKSVGFGGVGFSKLLQEWVLFSSLRRGGVVEVAEHLTEFDSLFRAILFYFGQVLSFEA